MKGFSAVTHATLIAFVLRLVAPRTSVLASYPLWLFVALFLVVLNINIMVMVTPTWEWWVLGVRNGLLPSTFWEYLCRLIRVGLESDNLSFFDREEKIIEELKSGKVPQIPTFEQRLRR